ncbi:hypothetical protein R6Q59_027501 [Mikania micrantha]
MDQDAARTAKESLELVFQMSNILDTGLDRHTLSVLIALCDLGLNPEALAAVVKEFRKDPPSTSRPSRKIHGLLNEPPKTTRPSLAQSWCKKLRLRQAELLRPDATKGEGSDASNNMRSVHEA